MVESAYNSVILNDYLDLNWVHRIVYMDCVPICVCGSLGEALCCLRSASFDLIPQSKQTKTLVLAQQSVSLALVKNFAATAGRDI